MVSPITAPQVQAVIPAIPTDAPPLAPVETNTHTHKKRSKVKVWAQPAIPLPEVDAFREEALLVAKGGYADIHKKPKGGKRVSEGGYAAIHAPSAAKASEGPPVVPRLSQEALAAASSVPAPDASHRSTAPTLPVIAVANPRLPRSASASRQVDDEPQPQLRAVASASAGGPHPRRRRPPIG